MIFPKKKKKEIKWSMHWSKQSNDYCLGNDKVISGFIWYFKILFVSGVKFLFLQNSAEKKDLLTWKK